MLTWTLQSDEQIQVLVCRGSFRQRQDPQGALDPSRRSPFSPLASSADVRLMRILLKKSKIERRWKSREGRSLVISAAESLCQTITKTMIAFP
jgi:hypothetical protein